MAIEDVSGLSIQKLISLASKVAIVTGAAQGIGAMIARRFAEAGANLVLGDINFESVQKVADAIAQEFGVRAIPVKVDIQDEESVVTMTRAAVDALGRVDILVNNAAISRAYPLLETTAAQWDQTLDINLKGPFLCSREAAINMVAQSPQGGVIVNIVSVSGLRGNEQFAAYCSSKHGLVGLTRSMALELASKNIRVVGVAPTLVMTPMSQAFLESNTEETRRMRNEFKVPLGRPAQPDDIARVVLFAASPMATLITGTIIPVDAGTLAGPVAKSS